MTYRSIDSKRRNFIHSHWLQASFPDFQLELLSKNDFHRLLVLPAVINDSSVIIAKSCLISKRYLHSSITTKHNCQLNWHIQQICWISYLLKLRRLPHETEAPVPLKTLTNSMNKHVAMSLRPRHCNVCVWLSAGSRDNSSSSSSSSSVWAQTSISWRLLHLRLGERGKQWIGGASV